MPPLSKYSPRGIILKRECGSCFARRHPDRTTVTKRQLAVKYIWYIVGALCTRDIGIQTYFRLFLLHTMSTAFYHESPLTAIPRMYACQSPPPNDTRPTAGKNGSSTNMHVGILRDTPISICIYSRVYSQHANCAVCEQQNAASAHQSAQSVETPQLRPFYRAGNVV